ncbi:hypothetical protein COBT_002933 [Conglomerata obtusa]
MLLQRYDFEIEYVKGKNNYADFLSRSSNICYDRKVPLKINNAIQPDANDETTIIEQHHICTGSGGLDVVYQLIKRKYLIKNSKEKIK